MRGSHRLSTFKEGKKLLTAWRDIKVRCYDTKNSFYDAYGGRGIGLQDSWLNDPVAFYSYMRELPNFSLNHSVDRIDNNKGYVEGNLRWATPAQQVQNRRKNQNNTSGKVGVTWAFPKGRWTYATAWWDENGKSMSKAFPAHKLGIMEAFKRAVIYREEQIIRLNLNGADYQPNHGLT